MKYKKVLSRLLCTLVISVAAIGFEDVSAIPKNGDILIQSIHGADEGIFSTKDGLWQPGMEKTNRFTIINNSDTDIEFKEFNIGNKMLQSTDGYTELIENTNIIILDNGKLLYKGSFEDTFKNTNIKLDEYIVIKAGKEKQLEMTIETLGSMNNVANVSMKMGLDFSLGITYETLVIAPKPTPEPIPNPGIDSNNTIPYTGGLIGSLGKSVAGIGILLAGILIVKKPRKKGDEFNG